MTKTKTLVPEITKAIQDINGNKSLTAKDKIEQIKKLKGVPFEKCIEYLKNNYSTGPELDKEIKKIISKKRADRIE